jgi:hypothetical protein
MKLPVEEPAPAIIKPGGTQGFLARFQLGAGGMRRLFNFWPPFRRPASACATSRRISAPPPSSFACGSSTVFLKPARGTVTARFHLPEERVSAAKQATAGGSKFEPVFRVDIVDEAGVTVADVEKTLYIRRKRETT